MRTTTYQPFRPPHHLAEHLTDPAMPPAGLDALAEAKVAGRPPEFVVIGEWRRIDGRRWLDLGLNPQYLMAFGYREHDGRLRWECPDCGKLGGKHGKACGYE